MVTSSCSHKNYSTFETNENDTQYLSFLSKTSKCSYYS